MKLFRAMRSALLHVNNAAINAGRLEGKTLNTLERIFEHYMEAWRQMELEKELKEEEEKSLFRYKIDTCAESLTDEEHNELEMQTYFVTFQQVSQQVATYYYYYYYYYLFYFL